MQNKKMEDKEPKKSKGHRCYFCGIRFFNIHILRKHVTTHKDRDIVCDVCGKDFTSSWGFKKHMKIHTGERPHQCDLCKKTFRQKYTLQYHIKAVHGSRGSHSSPLCRTCGKKVRTYADVQCWLCKYEEKPLFMDNQSVSTCVIENTKINNDNSNSTSSEVKAVEASSYSLDVVPSICTISTASVKIRESCDTLDQHNHSFSCDMCRNVFPTSADLKQHQLNYHNMEQTFKCDHCGTAFGSRSAVQRHSIVHSSMRPYTCMTCSKGFKTKACLKQHLQTHSENRPFLCKICGNSFKKKFGLEQHLVTHNNEFSFVCKDCGMGFKSLQRLKNHIVIVHTTESPMKCIYCERIFNHSGNLKRHIRIHTGERPYVCQICSKNFAQSSCLKVHELIHIKVDKPVEIFTCSLCGRHFKLVSNFKKHMSTHL